MRPLRDRPPALSAPSRPVQSLAWLAWWPFPAVTVGGRSVPALETASATARAFWSLRARRPRRRTGLLAGVMGRLQSARPAAPGAGSLPPPALPSAPQGGSPSGQRARLRLSRRLKGLARCQSALARCGPLAGPVRAASARPFARPARSVAGPCRHGRPANGPPLGLAGAGARAPRSLRALRPRAGPGLLACPRIGLVSAAGFALRVGPCAA